MSLMFLNFDLSRYSVSMKTGEISLIDRKMYAIPYEAHKSDARRRAHAKDRAIETMYTLHARANNDFGFWKSDHANEPMPDDHYGSLENVNHHP